MRIGINCIKINPEYSGGINTYTFGLLGGFIKIDKDNDYYIFVSDKNIHLFDKYKCFHNVNIILAETNDIGTLLKKIIRRVVLFLGMPNLYRFVNDLLFKSTARIVEENSDIIYIPTTVLDYFSYSKTVIISMHDIQYVHYPEFFTKQALLYHETVYGLSAKYTPFIQASSQFIKDDLLNHFGYLKEEQVKVIFEGVNINDFRNHNDILNILNKYSIPEKFLFYPAQLWKHKNHITVLRALNIMKKGGLDVPLVLTGARYSASNDIFGYIKENKLSSVFYLGKVPFEDFVALYQQAKFLITAVLYESSSLPILEAAASGTPIIASKTPPNIEISNILRLNLFEPLDEKELADLIAKLWNDEDIVSKQIHHNNEHIQYYTWENAAERYLTFLRRN
ncbi:MAG: glycosyltransferase family 4 protein [Armatimonadetes bacterium]|nr:glycosyltransferase family 4 protein [Armatimonadota bacterium]